MSEQCRLFIQLVSMISLKQIKECDIQMVSKNLSISTCPIEEVIEAPPPPRELRIDIRMVFRFFCMLDSVFFRKP